MMGLDFTGKRTVLVVDDTPDNLFLMKSLLQNIYKVKVASSGEQALHIAASDTPPDLILLDVMMPEMDGYEVCRRLKNDRLTLHIPVIFLTAKSAVEDEEQGLELGAVDYITKPISPPIVLARVKAHLALKAMDEFLRDQNHFLELEVVKRTQEVTAIQDVTILALASLAETRDEDTGNHLRRTQFYVKALAEKLRDHPRFTAFLSTANIEKLFKSAPLHDIGKVGIPDHILLKQGRLDAHEFEIMKTHTTLGYNAILNAEKALGAHVEFLSIAMSIALSHQEKWDGSGYPQGLARDDIPIAARLMAVADVYDALISRRVYKEAMPHALAVQTMMEGRARHFDADMLDAFVEIQEEFRAIAERFADTDAELQHKALILASASVAAGVSVPT
jgi:putative two-component system response regulator